MVGLRGDGARAVEASEAEMGQVGNGERGTGAADVAIGAAMIGT